MHRQTLVEAMNAYLDIGAFKDYCPNGLQVEGKDEVQKVALAVTASYATIACAASWGADMLVVHHGYFWKGESPVLTGMKGRRVRALMASNMNMVAYHLPLDAHPEVGNNACWAKALGLEKTQCLETAPLVCQGVLPAHLTSLDALVAQVTTVCQGRTPLVVGAKTPVRTLGVCTGAAQDFLEVAAQAGCDVYLSGEISERTTHEARELGVTYISAGHHATERLGIQALGEWLKQAFPTLEIRYFEDPNPV